MGSSPGTAKIEIYNSRGQLIRSYTKTHAVPGFYSFVFDGKDEHGTALASGVYISRMRCGSYEASRRMLITK